MKGCFQLLNNTKLRNIHKDKYNKDDQKITVKSFTYNLHYNYPLNKSYQQTKNKDKNHLYKNVSYLNTNMTLIDLPPSLL